MSPRLCWLLLGLLAFGSPCLAQPCPSRDGFNIRSDEARLKFLSAQLLAESGRAHNWTLAWGSIYGILTLGQIAAVPLIIPQDQVEWWIAAATTAVGIAFTVHDPLEVMQAGPGFASRAKEPGDVCALIAEGEGLLERSADHEARNRRWYIHATSVVLNLGIGLILGLVYDHWVAGAINVLLGVAFGEATIFSSPTRLISAWAEYQRGELGEEPAPVSFRVFPILHKDGAGLGFALSF